ncbi:hypothetical protein E2P81_ATG07623 [Venturia nashicola]|uniref:Uncharacterized protein n=1 Tax=Venturia nashicola TaxID=86259 RepID=A0A4Z1NWQ6_9PEZI|nr:hypothetical protein E6O75_ATG07781 [Venturia nashicola]TLD32133.1 hypothetical protein E2P81_ATG07623 [Venturia nashicola]
MPSRNLDSRGSPSGGSGNPSNAYGAFQDRQAERSQHDQQVSFARQATVALHNSMNPTPQNHYLPHQGYGVAYSHQQPQYQNPQFTSQISPSGMNASFPIQIPPSTQPIYNQPPPVAAPNIHELEYIIDVFVRKGSQDFSSLLAHYHQDRQLMAVLATAALHKYKHAQMKIERAVARLRLKQEDEQNEGDIELINEIIQMLTGKIPLAAMFYGL